MDLFKDWLPSVTEKKGYMFAEGDLDEIERKYPAFMMNRALSQYEDTVLLANEMNCSSHLDPKIQYDFLYYSVPKKRRFSKWAKAQKDDTINMISTIYQISTRRAEEVADLFSDEDIEALKQYQFKGGKNEKPK
jgi:hypothetical protein